MPQALFSKRAIKPLKKATEERQPTWLRSLRESAPGRVVSKGVKFFLPDEENDMDAIFQSINPLATFGYLPKSLLKERIEALGDVVAPNIQAFIGRRTGDTFKKFLKKAPNVMGHLVNTEIVDEPNFIASWIGDNQTPLIHEGLREAFHSYGRETGEKLEQKIWKTRGPTSTLNLSPRLETQAKLHGLSPEQVLREEINHGAQFMIHPEEMGMVDYPFYHAGLYNADPIEISAKVGALKGLGRHPKGFSPTDRMIGMANSGMKGLEKNIQDALALTYVEPELAASRPILEANIKEARRLAEEKIRNGIRRRLRAAGKGFDVDMTYPEFGSYSMPRFAKSHK